MANQFCSKRELLCLRNKRGHHAVDVLETDGSISEMSLAEFVRIAPLSQWRNPKSEIRHLRTMHRFLVARANTRIRPSRQVGELAYSDA